MFVSAAAGDLARGAVLSRTSLVPGYPSISRLHDRHHSRKPGYPHQRPRPPQLSRHRQHGAYADVAAAIGPYKADRTQELLLRKAEQAAHSRVLQRGHG